MQKIKITLGVLMVVGIFGCGSLVDAIEDAFSLGHDFETSCVDSDDNACGSSGDDCGCGKWDKASCADSTDSDTCRSCCEELGDNYGMSMYMSSGDTAECGCLWNGQ
jgi:hypothetical protein